MRRVVYYTDRGNRTPHLEDALIVGLKKLVLIDIPDTMAKPANRPEALKNLKMGLTF